MKADSLIILILAVSLVTICIAGVIGDMNNNYNANASTSWENKYNFAGQINDSLSKVADSTAKIGQESGWLQIISGAGALAEATVTTVFLILSTPFYTTSMIQNVASEIGIPQPITYIILVMILACIIFIIVRFYRGENV